MDSYRTNLKSARYPIAIILVLFAFSLKNLTDEPSYDTIVKEGGVMHDNDRLRFFPKEEPNKVVRWTVVRESDGEVVNILELNEEEARAYSIEHPELFLVR